MIKLENITKAYGPNLPLILSDLDLEIKEKDFVVILGGSGSGKSTLLKLISKVEKPDSGHVKVEGKVSQVFQNYALFPWLSVSENISLPLHVLGLNKRKVKKQVTSAMKQVELLPFQNSLPKELSGGQKQRVGLGRAIAFDTEIILLDEPFSALDVNTTRDLHQVLLNHWKNEDKTIVMISHSIEEAIFLARKIVILKNGEISKIMHNHLFETEDSESEEYLKLFSQIRKHL